MMIGHIFGYFTVQQTPFPGGCISPYPNLTVNAFFYMPTRHTLLNLICPSTWYISPQQHLQTFAARRHVSNIRDMLSLCFLSSSTRHQYCFQWETAKLQNVSIRSIQIQKNLWYPLGPISKRPTRDPLVPIVASTTQPQNSIKSTSLSSLSQHPIYTSFHQLSVLS